LLHIDGTGELHVVYTGYAIEPIERNGILMEQMEKERDLTGRCRLGRQ
jgi:hypothetical protein